MDDITAWLFITAYVCMAILWLMERAKRKRAEKALDDWMYDSTGEVQDG